jgi:hypothetical protein
LTVIASAAKQSISMSVALFIRKALRSNRVDCFAALAMTVDAGRGRRMLPL